MKKIYFIAILLALIFSFHSLANEITAIKAAENMKNGLIVIDVRNKEEWKETGIIPNSILIQMLSSGRTIRKFLMLFFVNKEDNFFEYKGAITSFVTMTTFLFLTVLMRISPSNNKSFPIKIG